jgi:hypothetical protein
LAWDWFEPILHEAGNNSRDRCSERTRRILGSYKEFKKALGQVFGQIDERKTAAEKIARLKQTTSVTLYIAEFQTIASSLDWDDDALEDKFLEGLKQEVRRALIYYTEEPENLDELFERVQRIDNELKKTREETYRQRRPFTEPGRRFYGKGPAQKKDGDGDTIMRGAKVDMEKAKRERLCFHCGKPGHQARFCRTRKKEVGKKDTTIRMLRTNRLEENESKLSSSTEGQNDDISEVSRMIDGLSLVDFNTDEGDSELEVCTVDTTKEEKIDELESRILDWKKNTHNTVGYGMKERNMHSIRGGKSPLLKRRYHSILGNGSKSTKVALWP